MSDTTTIETLEALRAERDALKLRIPELEAELKAAISRLSELEPGYYRHGLIELTRRKLRDQRFPIWSDQNGYNTYRIVDIGLKWISLRRDGAEDGDVTQYCRETGREKGTRKASIWNVPIDAAKALEIWAAHHAKQV